MRQAQIEHAAGIDEDIAAAMMRRETPAARSAMDLLWIQVQGYDPSGFALLQDAVRQVRQEVAGT